MAKTATQSFRFDEKFADLLDRMAAEHRVSKADLVRHSVLAVGVLFAEALRNLMADLAYLREKYGDDAELICRAEMGADGIPVGKVAIDRELVDDVIALPYADRRAGVAHVFLEVARTRGEAPNLMPFGDEWLLLPNPRMPIGALPWPPRPNKGLKIRLGDLAKVLDAEHPEPVAAVTV